MLRGEPCVQLTVWSAFGFCTLAALAQKVLSCTLARRSILGLPLVSTSASCVSGSTHQQFRLAINLVPTRCLDSLLCCTITGAGASTRTMSTTMTRPRRHRTLMSGTQRQATP